MIIFVDEHEGLVNKLRSIVAQLEYSYEIKQWDQKGVPFFMFLRFTQKNWPAFFLNEKMRLICWY